MQRLILFFLLLAATGMPVPASAHIPEEVLRGSHTFPYGYPKEETDLFVPPFGPADQRIGFQGHMREAKPGLWFLGAREYHAGLGRFLTTDPADDVDPKNPHTWNKYAFVRGNPLSFVDPDGRNIVSRDEETAKNWRRLERLLFGDPEMAGGEPPIPGPGSLIKGAKSAAKILPQLKQAARATETLVGKAAKGGEAVAEGIYELIARSGKKYVGQSKRVPKQLHEHVQAGKATEEAAAAAQRTAVPGGKTAREVAEQRRINELGGIDALENKCNPIGEARKHLMNE